MSLIAAFLRKVNVMFLLTVYVCNNSFVLSFISAIQIYTENIFVLKYSLIKLCIIKGFFYGLKFTHPGTLNGIQNTRDCIWVMHISKDLLKCWRFGYHGN